MRSPEHAAAPGGQPGAGRIADDDKAIVSGGGDNDADLQTRIEDAAVLVKVGARITPVGADKRPIGLWGQRVHADLPSAEQITAMATDPRARGWAILCGNHDAKIGVVDLEDAGLTHLAEARAVYDAAPDHAKYRTVSGGAHVALQITDGPALRTEKLAYRDTGNPDPEKRWELLAEVRGASDPTTDRAGAYAQITGPGRPPLRPDFAPWKVTAEQAEVLLAPLRAACQRRAWAQEEAAKRPPRRIATSGTPSDDTTTADIIFDAVADGRLDVLDVLPDGWTVVPPHHGRRINIGRPDGKSSVSGNVLDGVYVIHSTAVPWADTSGPMPAADVLARSRHNRDHAAAMRAVEDAAEGRPSPYAHWPAAVLQAVADNRARQVQEYIEAKQAELAAWEASLSAAPSPSAPATTTEAADDEATEDDRSKAKNRLAPRDFTEADEAAPPNTWQRQSLDAILDGDYVPEVADLLPRDDGVGLFYRGRTHSIHAESESGKSLVVQHEAARLLNAGENVAYIDFESDAASVVRRLLDLGADPQAIRDRFDYRRPEIAPAMGTDEGAEWAALLHNDYALVVIDGVTEAMDILAPRTAGGDLNERIASWLRRYPTRVADRTGAAVVLIDHVVKNAENRGRHAYGGQHKMNGLTGAAYTVEVKTQPRRGHVGELHLYVAKDRPAGVRPHCGPVRPDRTQLAAVVTIDSTGDRLAITVAGPADDNAPTASTFRPTALMERVSRWLQAHPGAHSRNRIAEEVPGNKAYKLQALDLLAAEGYAVVTERPRGSMTQRDYAHARLFTEADDAADSAQEPKPVQPVQNRSQTGPRTDTPQTGPTGPTPLQGGPVDGTGIDPAPNQKQTSQTGPDQTGPDSASGTEAPTCPACGREHGLAHGDYCYRCWHLDPDLGQRKDTA